ncbi:hypothetical protein CICLE_v10005915mg [Citrus x clementina]|uniref:RING-type domain-containing protein n=2 Tax=Citrus TaxID=2706 RepID=V4S8N1_CITCL|nr:E3 ubiquitin-protein ligase RNF12-B [Citrus x clementina]ESR33261.1 hypothetical protein CICLE_v10005915mg [Citrus x clementina]
MISMQLRLSPSHLLRKSRERRKYRTARKTDRIWSSLHRTNMAGMLPGVGVPQRRKIISKQHRQDSPCSRCEIPLTELREPLATCISDLDENALRARQRLEQKLASLHPRSRPGEVPQNKSSGKEGMKDTRLGSKLLWGSHLRHLKLRGSKSNTKICSVCLEEFQEEQPVTRLPCSHKYHSDCVLPWLAAHPQCPYCRRPALVW